MKALIIDDDQKSRRRLQEILSTFFRCDLAVDGSTGIQNIQAAFEQETPYKLVCLELAKSGLDEHEVLQAIRSYEIEKGVLRSDWSKVIMVSPSGIPESVNESFKETCDSHVHKPIVKEEIMTCIRNLGLIE